VTLRVGLLGDVMLGRMVGEALSGDAEPEEVWQPELRELARSLDLVILNLECCLSVRGAPTTLIPGKPFFFRGPPQAVAALEAVGAGVVGLANNHLLDFGEEAGADTVALLTAHGIATAGAGVDRDIARAPAVVARAGTRIGVLAVADHPAEYAAATDRVGIAYARLGAGVPAWLVDAIGTLRRRCDTVVVFVHWGANMTSRPAAWQRATAAELRAAGADLIAGHSAHVFHGVGFEQQRPVLYDLGGALDDYATDPLLRNDLGVLAIWSPGGEDELELVGLALDYCHTRLARGREADWIGDRLARACGELGSAVERIEENRFRVRPR
jgi:poly-gamma-glutamate capsule biosynthesis protein CapA/YwtB (metallophosphatase superfamily)